MATVILNHRVKDYTSWKKVFDGDIARRNGAGMKEVAVGQKVGDPGMVYMIWEVADASAMKSMLSDPGLQKTMQESGVTGAPEMIIVE